MGRGGRKKVYRERKQLQLQMTESIMNCLMTLFLGTWELLIAVLIAEGYPVL